MNDIAKQRTAEKFAEAVQQSGLKVSQITEITGIPYGYVNKAADPNQCGKVPQWVMHYLREWANTGESIMNAKWYRLAKGYPKLKPVKLVQEQLKAKGLKVTKEETKRIIDEPEPKEEYHGPGARTDDDEQEERDPEPKTRMRRMTNHELEKILEVDDNEEITAAAFPKTPRKEKTTQERLVELLAEIALDDGYKRQLIRNTERLNEIEEKLAKTIDELNKAINAWKTSL